MVRMKRKWSEKEEDFLRNSWAEVCSKEVARHLNRSAKAVRNKASRMGLHALKRCYGYPKPVKKYAPSSSLAYLIGVILGDGYVFIQRQPRKNRISPAYCVRLRVKDFEFASQFRETVGKVVGRYPKVNVIYQHASSVNPGARMFTSTICDKDLFYTVKQPLERLKFYIEAFPTDFVRGFFDSDGSAWINNRNEPVVSFCNTDKNLLKYVRELLVRLGIFPTPKTYKSVGNLGKSRKPCYFFHIHRKDSVRRFMRLIGSSIPRKRLVL